MAQKPPIKNNRPVDCDISLGSYTRFYNLKNFVTHRAILQHSTTYPPIRRTNIMTDSTKTAIIKMRENGDSSHTITQALNLPESTVKSFCRRNKINSAQPHSITSLCENCGAPITRNPRRKHKRFCSDSCRYAWWKNHQHLINRSSANTHTCAHCGSIFTAYADRKYCSHECYISHRFGGIPDE